MKTNLLSSFSALATLGKTVLITAAVMTSTVGWAIDDPELQRIWTTVGSAGTVDESDRDEINFNHNTASLSPTVSEFPSAKIRYNVTAVDSLTVGPFPIMHLTYIDNGASAQVAAKLIRLDLKNGKDKTILRFDSNDFPQTNRRQQQQVTPECLADNRFEFDKFAYYIEVAMVQDNTTRDKASVEAIQLQTLFCVE